MEKCQAPRVNELFENHYFVLLLRLRGGGGWKTVNELIYVHFRPEDAAKAMSASQDKIFFGSKIKVSQHEGIGEWIGLASG